MLGTVVDALAGSGVRAAVVSTGFPAGMSPFGLRVREIEESVAGGADEVDVVISRGLALRGDWRGVYDEVCAFRAACGDAHLKVILGTGDLGTLTNVARASVVCMMAGADFVKTSTGKEAVNATLPVGLVMCRAVREYWERTGFKVGLKPAGGIRTAKQALDWLMLVREELGAEWCVPGLFRLGASTLLGDIERQLLHCGTGRYGAWHEMPLG
jgi:deoxyribose-phosphate aldolase